MALGGLSVVAVVKANATLGDVFNGPLPARSVIVVDQGANPEQRAALVNMAKVLAVTFCGMWSGFSKVSSSRPGPMVSTVRAGELAALQTRCMSHGDHLCGNEDVFYPPLTKVADAMPAFTLPNSFQGHGLNTTWSIAYKRNAFIGSFAR